MTKATITLFILLTGCTVTYAASVRRMGEARNRVCRRNDISCRESVRKWCVEMRLERTCGEGI
jgi:hypothetical protein